MVNGNISKKNIKKTLTHVFIYALTVLLMFPLFWMIMTSFKPAQEWVTYPPTWIPREPTILNYQLIVYGIVGYRARPFPSAAVPYLNSVIVAGTSTLIGIIVGILASYSVSRFKTGGPSFLLSVIMPRMFPPMAMIIPMMVFFRLIGAIDTYWGLIILYTGFTLPYSVLMLKGFMDSVPKEFIEAAMLDGLSEWQILYKICVPIIKNGLMTTALFLFILNWTEYTFAMTLASRGVETIPVTLAKLFSNEAGTYYGPQSALGILAAIPTIVFGIIIHKYLAYGFTFGAIKK
ncbi:carbohydrate ABC transporter permease [Candidatus Bathyarchaeota archaeon]|nr:carbohydrate ABC transporter permease [Candidatus Bathyarchaeota archaeon]